MRISTVLCLCAFLLCCTGAADRTCRRFGISAGGAAALSLLIAAGSAFDIPLAGHGSLNPGALILLATTCALCAGRRGTGCAVLLAFACGVAAWVLQGAFPAFYEPGALLCLPAALLGRALLRSSRQGMLCTALAPLFFALVVMAEDWYLFDLVAFSAGSALQFDMQLCGLTLYALLCRIPARREWAARHAGRIVQKEG